MKKTVSFLFAIALVAVLHACINTPSTPEFIRVPEAEGASNAGWIAFSLTKSGAGANLMNPELYFRGVDNGVDAKIETSGSKLRADTPPIPIPIPKGHVYSVDDPLGSMKVVELPAGSYQFYRYYGSANPTAGLAYSVSYTLRSPNSFSAMFSVIPGKVTYIGNINFDFSSAAALQGGRISYPVRFEIHDKRERDIALFRTQFPDLKSKDLALELAKGK